VVLDPGSTVLLYSLDEGLVTLQAVVGETEMKSEERCGVAITTLDGAAGGDVAVLALRVGSGPSAATG
jgi:hypothetical protein